MGRALLRLAASDDRFALVAGASRSGQPVVGVQLAVFSAGSLGQCPPFDVAIDFSLPEGFDALLAECVQRDAGLVSGTTGLSGPQRSALAKAGESIPVVWASNFSVGVVVMEDLLKRAAAALPEWQVDIVETHHVHKKDAPSGTALSLARAIAAVAGREPEIRSRREGEVVGEHVVGFSGPGERIELRHLAGDRDIFARGALEAAVRLHDSTAGQWSLARLLLNN